MKRDEERRNCEWV